jgi:Na+/proline symporter
MNITLASILAYLVLQFGIGLWASRRIRSENDYLIAGRQLGYTLALFSIFATWFGAETVVGSAGNAYRGGVSLASAEPFGYGLCLLLMAVVFAGPLWRRRLTTLADLYRERYSRAVERLAAVILIPGSLLWAAAQIRAFGHVIATAGNGIPVDTGIAVATAFVMLYTVFGGLLADALTDLMQGVMLTVGLLAVLVALLLHVVAQGEATSSLAAPVAFLPAAAASPLELLEEWATPVLGSVVAAELVGRIVAARAEEVARRAALSAAGLYLAVGLVPVAIGLIGRQVVPGLSDAEQVIPAVALDLLPTAFYAIFAGGLISAILSTVDSTLLIASGIMSHNILVPLLRVGEERTKVRMARAGVLVFGAVAYLLAVRSDGVFSLVELASGFGSAGVTVTVTFALFTRLGGPLTAAATLLAGLIGFVATLLAGGHYPFLVSLALALSVYLLGSLLGRRARLHPDRTRLSRHRQL